MNPTKKSETGADDLPNVRIKRQRRLSVIWIVPLIAAAAAGWLIFKAVWQTGPLISIQFRNGNEIEANQTTIRYRGVRVGDVRSVQLSKDAQYVNVQARLDKSAENLAREGSIFWIVRPEMDTGGLRGLETIVSGPFIQVRPGDGKKQKKFIGTEKPPVLETSDEGGLEIILTTPRLGTLTVGAPVYYRGVEVGSVHYFVLNNDSTLVNIHILIMPDFAPLVHADSKFWNAGGINVDLSLFGVDISAESLKSLIIGGIAFATPSSSGILATNGSCFSLNEKMDDKWIKWSPAIAITNGDAQMPQNSPSSLILNSVNPSSKQ